MLPTKLSLCEFLSNNITFSHVIDVGTHQVTSELQKCFKNTHQLLIEPQQKYNKSIARNYIHNNYTLLNIGCDKTPGKLYLRESETLGTHNQPTHNHLTTDVTNNTVNVDTLDNISRDLDEWLLLKIDVDGKEADVLRGASKCLKKCGFVIIEATMSHFNVLVDILYSSNFSVYGIVDLCYVQNCLWQVDLVFINNVLKHNPEYSPLFNPREHLSADEFLANYYSHNDVIKDLT